MSKDAGLTETRIDGEQVFDGKLLKVYRDRVMLPDGSEAFREYVKHPGACVVIAEVEPGVILLERQFRYPVGRVFLELPAGKLDPGESELVCAQRELEEETGYTAASWRHLGTMHPCIGYSDERIEIFLARELSAGAQKLDAGEFLELVPLSIEDACRGVLEGRITDAKSVTALFFAREALSA